MRLAKFLQWLAEIALPFSPANIRPSRADFFEISVLPMTAWMASYPVSWRRTRLLLVPTSAEIAAPKATICPNTNPSHI